MSKITDRSFRSKVGFSGDKFECLTDQDRYEETFDQNTPITLGSLYHILFIVTPLGLVALIFLIFDVEVAFLIPWAVVFGDIGAIAFIEIIIFLVILGLGLLYAYKKGALKWE